LLFADWPKQYFLGCTSEWVHLAWASAGLFGVSMLSKEVYSSLCLFLSIFYSVFQRCSTRDEISFPVGQSNSKKRSKFSKNSKFQNFKNFITFFINFINFKFITFKNRHKLEYTSRDVYSLNARHAYSEVELRKCCLGQSAKSKISYHLLIVFIKW
jgi:hypothetical protein